MKIKDESGDKKYFTIIPNYILNHSTMWDREVYIQMKRIAGENGTCWASQKTLAKQCGMSINRLKKSINYLVEHEWIKFVGKKEVGTKGGNQYVNEYTVIDLWDLNMRFYENKGVSPKDTPCHKGVSPDDARGYHENAKGVSPDDDKEEPLNNNLLKKNKIFLSEKYKKASTNERKTLPKPTYWGFDMRWKPAVKKWFVLKDGDWSEYADKETAIEWV